MKGATKAVLAPPVAVGKAVSGAVNTVATSPAALGGEVAQAGVAHILPNSAFGASWKRTADASTWTLPDGKIGPTFGRAVAGAVGLKPGAEAFNALSGALGAFMYVAAPDPLGAAGRVVGKARSAEGFGDSFLGRHFASGTAAMTPSAVESAYTQLPGFRMAVKDMAKTDTAGEIAMKYPTQAPLSSRLAQASTVEEVKDVYKDAARTQELATTSSLPELGPYSSTKSAGRKVTGLFTPAPTAFDAEAQKFTGHTLDVGSDTAGVAIGHLLIAAGEDDRVVHQVVSAYQDTGDPRMKLQITKNAFKVLVGNEILRALPRDSPDEFKASTLSAMNDAVDNMFGGEGAGHTGQFGRDTQGGDLSRV